MKAYFLSDLHLRNGDDAPSRRFAAFLRTLPGPADTLLLGGDIFDLFVGDKPVFREKHRDVLAALRECALAGTRVHYLEGNHDFHVRQAFAGLVNFRVHADDFGLAWGDKQILISHGDMIDPEDRGYRFLRAFTRHFLFRFFLRFVPGRTLDALGAASSKKSRQYNHEDAGGQAGRERLRALYVDFARRKIAEGYDHVLVGHSHLADQISVEAEGILPGAPGLRRGEYVNLGFSAEELRYAELSAGAPNFAVKTFA